jgi:hypothetical protein
MQNGQMWAVGLTSSRSRLFSTGGNGALLLVVVLFPVIFLSGCVGSVAGKSPSSTTLSFALSPASLNFGKVAMGQKTSQTVTVTNTGNAAVTIQQATVSNSQFVLSGITLPMSMAAGQGASFSVWLNGTTAGSVSGTLTLQGDVGTTPAVVSLAGTVSASSQPQLSVSAGSLNLGSVIVGSNGTANLLLTNLGSADLTISMITMSGAEFGISGINTPRTISTGQTVPVTVTFSPTSAGSASGNIAITSNDPTNPTTNVILSGTGSTTAIGQLVANPTSLSFGTVSTGSNTSQNITLTNTGSATVQITGITAAGAGFSVSGVTPPATLAASQTATLVVKFAPTTTGAVTGSITVASNASGSPLTIALTGTGAQAGLSVSPASFSYGSVVDGLTKSQSFTLTNTGTAALTIAQLTVTGAGYSVSGLNTPATLAAGQSTTFSALFAPTTAGALNGSVSIASNAPNSPTVVALSGTGTAASVTMSASPTSVSFGSINAGASSSKSVTLTNSGNSNLTISQISVSAKDVTTSGITTPATLAPGQNATLNVAFNPTASETVTGNVTVTSSQGSSVVLPVSGSGIQATLAVTPGSVSFGNVTVGTANTQTIQLRNTGTAVLTVTQLTVTGSGFSNGTLNLPLSLNPGTSTTFNVQFLPQSAGTVAGTLSVVSNAPNSPTAVVLGGSGVASILTLALSPSSLSFANVNTGSSASQSFTITDTGNANVTISQINISGSSYSLSGAGTPVTLSPTQGMTVTVHFSPSAAGSVSGNVSVVSNSSGSPANVTLSGTGVQPATHSVALSWTASTSTVSGYNVYRSTMNGSGYRIINSGLVGTLTYVDSSVQSGTTYYYVTTAVDSSSNESAYSNQASAVIP